MANYYTGIGSRETPEVYLNVMEEIAALLARKGYTLRSGGADGADSAFERGCKRANGVKEIFLPWSKFNGREGEGYYSTRDSHYEFYTKAKEIARQHHPVWDSLKDGAKKLHTRNVHQVLGVNVDTPSDFVVCWSQAAASEDQTQWRGGTGQALRLATSLTIPTYNLANDKGASQLMEFLRKLEGVNA